jgi:transposase-like protein
MGELTNKGKPKLTPEELSAIKRRAIMARWKDRTVPPKNAAEIIRDAVAEGATVQNIAAAFGISRETFYKWKDNFPEFAEAVKQGRQIEHDRLVNKLVEMALGGNVSCLIYALKARHGLLDNVINHVVENKVAITFQVPDSLKPEEYLKTLTAAAEVIPPDAAQKALSQPGVKKKVLRQISRSEEAHDAE